MRADPTARTCPVLLGPWPEVFGLSISFRCVVWQGTGACFLQPFLTQLLVPGKYWACMQRLASCPEPWVPRMPGADAEEVEAVTALASLSVGILAEER